MPPAYKADAGDQSVGYDVYDLWDLGLYKAHNDIAATKYGTYDELEGLIRKCHSVNPRIEVYADIVFNHKMGAKQSKRIRIQEVADNDKNEIKGDWFDSNVYSEFNFDDRLNQQRINSNSPSQNQFTWTWYHFDAVQNDGRFYRLKEKNFQCTPDIHFDHHPFLMGLDIDTSHPDVYEELCRYGEWLVNNIGIDGFRIDAIKHIRESFSPNFLARIRETTSKDVFAVGEFWEDNDVWKLINFISGTNYSLSLFDFRLRENFWQAANGGAQYSLKRIFDNTLVEHSPVHAVTFVDNHDLQPYTMGKSFDFKKHDWFKPLAYALILLRPSGYPCVFFGDYFPSELYREGGVHTRHQFLIDVFLKTRKLAVGSYLVDYFDHDNCIGWISREDETRKTVAVVMSNGKDGYKKMNTSKSNATYTDLTDHKQGVITTDSNGFAEFTCLGGKVSVWLEQ